MSYAGTALDGGVIIGAGDRVNFDPPGSSSAPTCLPYRMNVTVTYDVSGLTTEQTVSATVKLAGDANGDGIVNILDKVIIRNEFG